MKRNISLLTGGGGINNSLNASFSSNNSKRFFKPLVASSLALFLSANIASATCNSTTSTSGAPVFCYGNDASSAAEWKVSGISWNGGASGIGGGLFLPTKDQTAITTLKINFNSATSSNPSIAFTDSNATGTITTNNNYFSIVGSEFQSSVGGGKGIQIGNTGNGTLYVDLGSQTGKTFVLDLSKTQTGNTSFAGNITVTGGANNADLKFKETFKGNIILRGYGANLTATFEKEMIGNIGGIGGNGSSSAGTLTAKFNNGAKLTGNIQTGRADDANDFVKNEVTFDGANNATDIVMKGNITSYGTGYANLPPDETRGNHVTFAKGSLEGNIEARGRNSRNGFNEVKFTDASGGQKIKGDILASGTISNAKNSVSFSGTGTVEGNVNATVGTNILTFGGTTNSITGSVSAGNGSNTITFGTTATSSGQTKTSAINTISKGISASGGTNTITANNSEITINGSITNNAGTNTIKAENGNITIKKAENLNGSMIIQVNGGGNATNTISAQTLTIDVDKIEASGNWASANKNVITSTTNGTLKTNTITASTGKTPSTNTINFTSGVVEVGSGGISASGGKNDIVTNTITISGDISASSGTNTITANANNNSGITINSNITNDSGTNTIKAENGNITITKKDGKIETRGGWVATNTITAKNITIDVNSITAVYTNNNSKSTNTITATESGNITANITAQNKGTNNITLNGTGSNSITGNITAGGGTNNILIKNAATSIPSTPSGGAYTTLDLSATDLITALKSLSSLTGNITTNSNGNNNIVFENKIWMPSQVKVSNNIMNLEGISSGTLTTNGGTTNLVLRLDSATNSGVIPVYTVKTTGGTANLVMQGPVNVEADIDYGTSGITNLIFASNNDGKTADEFKNGVAG
ncbi:hypothetical protein CQA57_04760, partial [Helicobacter anseris]